MKTIILTTVVILLSLGIFAQVGINNDNTNPDPSAMLDVKSTDKGVLVPRMSTVQRSAVASPAEGLLVFDSTTYSFWFYSNSNWVELIDAAHNNKLTDADEDTRIELEKTADEDTIRFIAGGTEIAVMDNKTFHLQASGGSVFIGKEAGKMDDGTNNSNTATGYKTLSNNTAGFCFTAFGYQSSSTNSTGIYHTPHV